MGGAIRNILLVRHGETEWNLVGRWQGTTDIPLSDNGRAQARELGERLRGHGIARVFASNLSRARETAEIVTATLDLNVPVVVDARLRERGYGCFEGLTRDECAARFPDAWEKYQIDRRVVPPDGESQTAIITRVMAVMREIASVADLPDDASVLVVSHGGSIRSFVHAAVGVLLAPLGNGALVRLTFEDGRFRLLEGNR